MKRKEDKWKKRRIKQMICNLLRLLYWQIITVFMLQTTTNKWAWNWIRKPIRFSIVQHEWCADKCTKLAIPLMWAIIYTMPQKYKKTNPSSTIWARHIFNMTNNNRNSHNQLSSYSIKCGINDHDPHFTKPLTRLKSFFSFSWCNSRFSVLSDTIIS